MDEQIPDKVNEPQLQTPPPGNEEAKQYSRWMAEYGRPALIGLAVAVVVLLGFSIWRSQKEKKAEAAVQALFQNRGPEGFLELAGSDPETPVAPIALASAAAEFYAQNRYDDALDAYQRFLDQYPTNMLATDAALGVAASLEALDRFDEAAAGYEGFAAAHPSHIRQPQAVFGAARCREQLGQFDEARALYEDFITAHPESSWIPQAESGLLFLKKAERAKDLPPPAPPIVTETAPEVVYEMGSGSAREFEESAAAVEQSVAPAATETAVAEKAVPAAAEKKVAKKAPKPKKKSAKKAAEPPADEANAGEPAAE